MRAVLIVGARPQFVKAAVVDRALRPRHDSILIHTGQHYDYELSQLLFDELRLPRPKYNLGVGSSSNCQQTSRILAALEPVLTREEPDVVLVFGDTNSTLAGALAAAKLNLRLGHVEAGLRSYRTDMQEEVNRVVADRLADFLFCPTRTAVRNLAREGIKKGVFLTGDVMCDALRHFFRRASHEEVLRRFGLVSGQYYVATFHRAELVDSRLHLARLVSLLGGIDLPTLVPLHPRTHTRLVQFGLAARLRAQRRLRIVRPVSYTTMLTLIRHAARVITDSGGIQKEAYLLGVPCITLRSETEWIETLRRGWNCLVGLDPARFANALAHPRPRRRPQLVFGRGEAGRRICRALVEGV